MAAVGDVWCSEAIVEGQKLPDRGPQNGGGKAGRQMMMFRAKRRAAAMRRDDDDDDVCEKVQARDGEARADHGLWTEGATGLWLWLWIAAAGKRQFVSDIRPNR